MARYPNPFAAIRASWLVAQARQRSQGLSQTELAEEMGMGQAAMSKYEGGSREPSFADLQRIIAGTDCRLEVRLRPEPRRVDRIQSFQLYDPMPFATSDSHLARRLPAQLSPESGRLPASEGDGPRLEEALLHLYELQALAADLRQPEDRLQQTYERFHNERDRDLIHLMLPLGAGAGQAARILARAIDQGTDRPTGRRADRRQRTDPRASRLVWAHIVCCLRAEEGICRGLITRLQRALDASRLRRRAQIRVEDAELIARNSSRPGALADVDQAKAELEGVGRACADHSRNGGAEDVGLAGERYIAVELARLADRSRALYEELAGEPAFVAWRADHAPADPLYDAWLDGELRDTPAPPRLYPHWNALAKEHRSHVASSQQNTEPETGRVERPTTDRFGQRWQILLSALPGNDQGPASYVTAARYNEATQQKGPVYLLSSGADPARAADVITSGPASLSAVAASLRNA